MNRDILRGWWASLELRVIFWAVEHRTVKVRIRREFETTTRLFFLHRLQLRSPLDNWPAKIGDWPRFCWSNEAQHKIQPCAQSYIRLCAKISQSPMNIGQTPTGLLGLSWSPAVPPV